MAGPGDGEPIVGNARGNVEFPPESTNASSDLFWIAANDLAAAMGEDGALYAIATAPYELFPDRGVSDSCSVPVPDERPLDPGAVADVKRDAAQCRTLMADYDDVRSVEEAELSSRNSKSNGRRDLRMLDGKSLDIECTDAKFPSNADDAPIGNWIIPYQSPGLRCCVDGEGRAVDQPSDMVGMSMRQDHRRRPHRHNTMPPVGAAIDQQPALSVLN